MDGSVPSVPVGHSDFGTITPCQCQELRLEDEQRDRLLTYSNLGNLTRFRFDNLEPDGLSDSEISKSQFRKAYDVARVYANDPRGWLTLTGPNGAGKTHLAAAVANHCVDNSRIVFFSHAPDLLDHLRSSFGPASDISYSDLFEQVRTTPLLVLDGLGSQSATPWAEEKLRQIINHRFQRRASYHRHDRRPSQRTRPIHRDAADDARTGQGRRAWIDAV